MPSFQLQFYILILFGNAAITEGARILVAIPISVTSHMNVFQPIVEELSARGHEVVSLTMIKYQKTIPGTKEIVITMKPEDDWLNKARDDFFGGKTMSHTTSSALLYSIIDTCRFLLTHPLTQELLESEEHFDLLLLDAYLSECFLIFSHRFSCPLVLVAPSLPMPWTNTAMGNPNMYSFSPFFISAFSDRMVFWERLINTIYGVSSQVFMNFFFMPQIQKVVDSELGPHIPPLSELQNNASLVFTNSHYSVGYVKPNMPNVIEVGGLHCRAAKPLPQDLENFVNASKKHGFIYFSLGGTVQGSKMPENLRLTLLNTFSLLPQRVLWKWEGEMPDAPPNVKTGKWMPQQDILGHPNIRAFVTQGGALSIQEAVYHGVPVVVMPMIAEQEMNARHAVISGYGVRLTLQQASVETLIEAFDTVINDTSYRENAKRMSAIMKDQPETPLQRAVFWCEYVIRHRGAKHLFSGARDLTWYQYWLIDVVFVLCIFSMALLTLVVLIIRQILRIFRRKMKLKML